LWAAHHRENRLCGVWGELNAANTTAIVGPGADPGRGTAVIGGYLNSPQRNLAD
jgi:hypothetical protein